MTRVLALADQSKIGCITQRRFAKVGTKTHPQRGADLDRNGLSVSTETACRFEPKSPVGNSEICNSGHGLSTEEQEYNPTPIINEIRRYVEDWRKLPNPDQWQVTPETARLLRYWRQHDFESFRPFFCNIEAVETVIWLTEVAPKRGAAVSR